MPLLLGGLLCTKGQMTCRNRRRGENREQIQRSDRRCWCRVEEIYPSSGNIIHFAFDSSYVFSPALYTRPLSPAFYQSILDMPLNASQCLSTRTVSLSYLESIASHTTLVFVNGALAVFLRVVALAEEHAFVATGFLIFAHAAGFGFWNRAFSGGFEG